MWKLIELDAVMKLLKEHYPDAFEWVLYDFIFKIKALPQIDIVWEIEKMIEKLNKTPVSRSMNNTDYKAHYAKIAILQDLLQKFNS